jgi:GT2 family glycosyltransferase
LTQRVPDWLLTVVDDASPDDQLRQTLALVDDPRVTYTRNQHRLGVAGNFNRCLELVEEDFFVIMGDDDMMLPNYVEVVLSAGQRFETAGLIQPGVSVISQSGAPSSSLADSIKRAIRPRGKEVSILHGEQLASRLLLGNWLYFPSITWRRAAVAELQFRTDLDVVLDLALVLEVVKQGYSLVQLSEVAFQYRRHKGSVSSEGALDGSRFTEERRFFAEEADACRGRGWLSAARAAEWHPASRAHALAVLPGGIRSLDRSRISASVKHVFAR